MQTKTPAALLPRCFPSARSDFPSILTKRSTGLGSTTMSTKPHLGSNVLLCLVAFCWFLAFEHQVQGRGEECHLRPVIHVLQQPGCIPKPIPSFACQGSCSSYVQVSGSKFWQVERSCMCCQEMGEREASIGIFCPKASPRFRKIVTRAPVECMCRPCTAVDDSAIQPQELAGALLMQPPAPEDTRMEMGKEIPVV